MSAPRPARNPDWSRDEVILACDLVARNGWRYRSATDPEVIELSRILRSLDIHPGAAGQETFRNPNGVARKTADIATLHPDYTGKPTRGGTHDGEVLAAFLDDPEAMNAVAESLREAARVGGSVAPPDVDLDDAADEGGVLERRHLARERDPKLRARKITAVRDSGASIACEVCGFNFEEAYGERGRDYIEVHHRVPLHASGQTRTRLDDLALLCSNCHRMIHRRSPWLSIEALEKIMEGGPP